MVKTTTNQPTQKVLYCLCKLKDKLKLKIQYCKLAFKYGTACTKQKGTSMLV